MSAAFMGLIGPAYVPYRSRQKWLIQPASTSSACHRQVAFIMPSFFESGAEDLVQRLDRRNRTEAVGGCLLEAGHLLVDEITDRRDSRATVQFRSGTLCREECVDGGADSIVRDRGFDQSGELYGNGPESLVDP